MESRPLAAILVSLRDPTDAMARQEARCFRDVAGLDALDVVYAPTERLGSRELEADLLFFGGSGAYSVLDPHPWVRRTLDFLVLVAERGVPAWASCFGYQGLALAMGGKVVHDDDRLELGVYGTTLTEEAGGDPVFRSLPRRFSVQMGHHDHVDEIPRGATLLATGDGGQAHAMRVDGSNFWGAQFHPELTKETTWERWQHYRHYYAGTRGEQIDRTLMEAPDTPESRGILRSLVEVARARADR